MLLCNIQYVSLFHIPLTFQSALHYSFIQMQKKKKINNKENLQKNAEFTVKGTLSLKLMLCAFVLQLSVINCFL